MSCDLVTANHLGRKAVVYIRQSSPHQVLTNREGLRLQYALRQRARELGWREPDIEVIDRDLGRRGAGGEQRTGFKDLIARVTLGEVGLILSADVTRLTRNCSDWYPLLDLCGYRECLIADRDGVVRSRNPEREAPARPQGHDLRDGAAHLAGPADGRPAQQGPARRAGPATAGRPGPRPDRNRGQEPRSRGAGAYRAGLRHLPGEVQARIALVFATFLEKRSAAKVLRTLLAEGLALPRRDRHGDITWRPPTRCAICAILKNPAYAGAFVYGRTRT